MSYSSVVKSNNLQELYYQIQINRMNKFIKFYELLYKLPDVLIKIIDSYFIVTKCLYCSDKNKKCCKYHKFYSSTCFYNFNQKKYLENNVQVARADAKKVFSELRKPRDLKKYN